MEYLVLLPRSRVWASRIGGVSTRVAVNINAFERCWVRWWERPHTTHNALFITLILAITIIYMSTPPSTHDTTTVLWAPRFSKNRSIFGLVGPASSASATPGPKPPNKGWGRTFMDVHPAPTKSGNERLTHLEALGFYFGPHVLTRTDPNPAHGSN